MRPATLRLFAAVAALGVLGTGAATYLATSGQEEEVVPQAEVLAPSASPSTPAARCAVFVKDVPCNPDEGLSDAERHALYDRLRKEGEQRRIEWLNSLDIDSLDLRSLRREQIEALYIDQGQPSLVAAIASADLIVAGTVTAINPTPFSGTDTTISVDQTLKGPAAQIVSIRQGGGLEPTFDLTGVMIAETAAAPFLLPGDRAILFLQRWETTYYIQNFTGAYPVVGGVVRPSPGRDWSTSVAGKTEAEFVELLTTALNEAAAVSP